MATDRPISYERALELTATWKSPKQGHTLGCYARVRMGPKHRLTTIHSWENCSILTAQLVTFDNEIIQAYRHREGGSGNPPPCTREEYVFGYPKEQEGV